MPDVVLPSQFYSGGRTELQPEKRLMLAVLEHAVAAFLRGGRMRGPAGRRALSDLEDWFAAREGTWPFAFERICDALGFDAPAIRTGLSRWRAPEQAWQAAPSIAFRRVSGGRHVICVRRRGRRAGRRR